MQCIRTKAGNGFAYQEVESDAVADVLAVVHEKVLAQLQLGLNTAGLIQAADGGHGSCGVELRLAISTGRCLHRVWQGAAALGVQKQPQPWKIHAAGISRPLARLQYAVSSRAKVFSPPSSPLEETSAFLLSRFISIERRRGSECTFLQPVLMDLHRGIFQWVGQEMSVG